MGSTPYSVCWVFYPDLPAALVGAQTPDDADS
jgi:hypothetical protein